MDNYEEFLGKIHPGFLQPISSELQKSVRQLTRDLENTSCWALLTIQHSCMAPEEITSALSIEPSEILSSGESYYQDGNSEWKSDLNLWVLSSQNKIKSKESGTHLEWILKQVFGKLPQIRSLQDNGAKVHIQVHCESSIPSHTELSPSILQRLAQLRCDLSILHYPPPTDFDEE